MKFLIMLFFVLSFSVQSVEYVGIVKEMQRIAATYPEKAQLFTLTKNDQNEPVYGIYLKPKAAVAYSSVVVGAHHGNEQDSALLAVQVIKDILKFWSNPNYQNHSFHQQGVYIVPVLNVNGFKANRREELDRQGRRVDPNRNYPDPCVNKKSFTLKSTAALAKLIDNDQSITRAVTIHGYIGTLTYPWGTFTLDTKTPDHQLYKKMFAEASKHNNYRVGTHSDVIYPAVGAFEDWAYHAKGIWTMLVEMDHQYNLKNDANAVFHFLAQAPVKRSSFHDHTGQCQQNALRRGGIRWVRP
jgi:hypothetical protein